MLSVDLYIRESGPPIQQMIIDDAEPCKQNVVEYSRIFWQIHFVCSCMFLYVVFSSRILYYMTYMTIVLKL